MMEEEITLEAPVTGEMIALMTVLSLFTVVGTVGNGLVLFVFSRVRDKTTAQLFILALAVIDLFTCMVIIPLTMFVEYTRYDIKYDWLCKLYQFLITSKVPLSAFIMVAIAFDRYFCICHPLRKIITPWRTKVTLVSLAVFAAMLGMMTSMAYGVNQVFSPYDPDIYNSILNSTVAPVPPDTIKDWTKLGEDPSTKNDVTMSVELRLKLYMLKRNISALASKRGVQETVYIGICAPNEILLDWDFVSVYQKCYTALFLICLVIVGVLYGMIYRFIGMRRNRKLQQRLVLCAYVNSAHGCREPGTRITVITSNIHDNHTDDDKSDCSAQGLGPGGIYIGGCTTIPAPSALSTGSHFKASSSLNVSFAEPESEKSVSDHLDEKNSQEDGTSIGNFRNTEKFLSGEDCDDVRTNNEGRDTGDHHRCQSSVKSHEEHVSFKSDPEITNSSDIAEDDQTDDSTGPKSRKSVTQKSPSLGSSTRTKRKGLWKSSRRPKSLAEDNNSKENNTSAPRFRKRRASSPFKHHSSESSSKHVPWMEMRNLRCRRDSEPHKHHPLDTHADISERAGHGNTEDLLTIGSRKHYNGTYLETSIGEDYCLYEPDPRTLRSTCLMLEPATEITTSIEIPDNPSLPIIHVTDNDMVPDPETLQHHLADLIHTDYGEDGETVTEHSQEQERNGTYMEDCDTSKDAHSASVQRCFPQNENEKLSRSEITDRQILPTVLKNPIPSSETPEIRVVSSALDDPSHTTATNTTEAPEIPAFRNVWDNESPRSNAQQQSALLTTCANVTPACSSTSCNPSPRQSYGDVSRRWTMEGSSTGGSPSLDPGHHLSPDMSRRSTMESRRSTMDSTFHRPRGARKKRWQHFRCKNASIKGSHSRHHKASAGAATSHANNNLYGRRSIVSYNADRLRDETRAANARTALMLFTVTLVFVVAFLPAWLMAHRLVATQLMVFYLYFTYNVANPFIYAFMNVTFKEQLRKISRCWWKRWTDE